MFLIGCLGFVVCTSIVACVLVIQSCSVYMPYVPYINCKLYRTAIHTLLSVRPDVVVGVV